ncbi:sigma 54-interacting transcriptional regulator [Frisingicoccus sp.]|uniref:sigma 54-interacting transcriptional regulator n=1 Tax=Frisingicoccus sp. TaxID=1918627 RepID=UPI003AB39DCB
MAKIGIILELDSTYYEALSASKNYPDGTIDVVKVTDYEGGIKEAKKMVKDGTQILISRAGYILKLRSANISIPIVEIPFSTGKLLGELVRAQKQYGTIGLAGTNSLLEAAKEVECALDNKIHYYEVNSAEDYEKASIEAKKDGIHALVGGYDETRYANMYGIERIILTTSEDEILFAISEAKNIIDHINIKNKQNEELNTIFNIIDEGLVKFDEKCKVTLMNQPAAAIFGVSDNNCDLNSIFPLPWIEQIKSAINKNETTLNVLLEHKNNKYVTSIYPFCSNNTISGAVVKLQRFNDVQGMAASVRSQLSKQGLIAAHTFEDIIGNSSIIKEKIVLAKRYSGVDSTVLITGESGTGKELFAQSIHNCSPRANGPFVAVNCAAIPSTLLESELFGYIDGAFTGAKKGGKVGLFELAHKGTIFLDEIGEIDISIQTRLLRVLEERRIMRLGDDKIIPVNVRIIAATNKNLQEMVKKNQFREDFFYRLNVLAIELPPLRNRKPDLEMLIHHLLLRECTKMKRPLINIKPEAMELLYSYNWPGNIRELANIIERLVVVSMHKDVDAKTIKETMGLTISSDKISENAEKSTFSANNMLKSEEISIIHRVLDECGGNKTEAACKLGISRPTLYKKLKNG